MSISERAQAAFIVFGLTWRTVVRTPLSSKMYWLSFFVSAAAVLYLLAFPSTAWALTILAIPPIAFVLRDKVDEKEKAVWVVVSLLLIFAVHRGLKKDQMDQEKFQRGITDSFQRVGQQIEGATDRLGKIADKIQQVAETEAETLTTLQTFRVLVESRLDEVDRSLEKARLQRSDPLKIETLQLARDVLQFAVTKAATQPSIFPGSPSQFRDLENWTDDLRGRFRLKLRPRIAAVLKALNQRGIDTQRVESICVDASNMQGITSCADELQELANQVP